MKFLLTVAAVIAVAVAGPTQRGLVAPAPGGPLPIFVEPGFGPAIVDNFEPVAIGPALIDSFEPVAIGPAFVDTFEPIAVGPANPVVVEYGPASGSATASLVQIIVNINQASASPVEVSPVQVVDNSPVDPVHVVDEAPAQIVDVMPIVIPELPIQIEDIMPIIVPDLPIQIEDVPVVVEPVHVVETSPVAVEPVQIGTPMIPAPAVVLPEQLN